MARQISASVFLDIDETLCCNGEAPSQAVMDALRQLKANGHRLFFCTARTLSTIPLCLIELEPDGAVGAAGSRVIAGNSIIYDRYVDYEELRPLVAHLLDWKIPFSFETKDNYYTLNGYSLFAENSLTLGGMADFDALGKDLAVSKMSFFTKELYTHKELLEEIIHIFELIVYSSGYCEAILSDVSKGLGIRMIMEHMNLPLSNSYAIGDNLHDITMFHSVETGIAMGNADAELKAAADFVTGSVLEDGVVQALKHFSLI